MSPFENFIRLFWRGQGEPGAHPDGRYEKPDAPAGRYRLAVGLLLGLALVRGLLYALLTPPWQAPDEPGHFEYAWAIARRAGPPLELFHPGTLLTWLQGLPRPNQDPAVQAARPRFERELLDSLYEARFFEYRHRPPPEPRLQNLDQIALGRTLPGERFSTAYVWQALFIAPRLGGSVLDQLYLARLSSVALNLGIIVLGIGAARTLFPDRAWLALAVGIALIFWPQHTFINATVNDGPMAELGATLAVYGWARLLARTFSLIGIAAVVAGTLLGLSAKANAAFLLGLHPLLLVVYLTGAVHPRHRKAVPFGLAAAVLLLGGLWVVYQADLISLDRAKVALEVIRQRWGTALDLAERASDRPWWWVFDSYWGFFGWMHVRVSDGWYRAAYGLTALGLAGWLIPRRDFPWPGPGAAAIAWLAPTLATGMLVLYIAFIDPTYLQGRYLFTAAVPATVLLAVGWARLVPARLMGWFLPGLCLVLASLDLVALWAWLTFFYP